MDNKVSIIIPVFNIDEYLMRCLESVLNQSYTNLEIILIDDGSTDQSGEICNEYAAKDKRVLVVHKENEGVSIARNIGLDMASGDFIGFVDGDDMIERDMIQKLVQNSLMHNADISICQMDTININGKADPMYKHNEGLLDCNEVIRKFFFDNFTKSIMYSQCNKIYRRAQIKNLRYRTYKYGEDILFVFESLKGNPRIYFDDYIGYHYLHRETSAMTSSFTLSRLDYLNAGNDILNICEERYPDIVEIANSWLYQHALVMLRNLLLLDNNNNLKTIVNEIRIYIKQNRIFLKQLPAKRKLDYIGGLYFPLYFKILRYIKDKF